MVSTDKNKIYEIKKDKIEFGYRFIQKISEKKLLSSFFSELESKTQLLFLSTLGVPDANSYQKKSQKRIRAYLTSKNPALIFKKKGLSNKNYCQRLLTDWSLEVITKISEPNSLPDEQPKEDTDLTDEISCLISDFISAIKHFYHKKELQRVYNLLACFIANPLLPNYFDPSEEDELIDTLDNLSKPFLKSLIQKLEEKYSKEENDVEMNISNLKEQYIALSEVFSESAHQIKEFGELPNDSLIDLIAGLKESFKELKESILKNADQSGYPAPKEEDYTTLNELIDLADKIQEFKNNAQLKLVENATILINQLKKIEIDGSQDDEKLIEFFNQINNKQESWIKSDQKVEEFSSGQHPLAMLITAIAKKDGNPKSCKELQKVLIPYCGNDVATYLMFKLMTNDLSFSSTKKIETKSSEPKCLDQEKKQDDDIQSTYLIEETEGNEPQCNSEELIPAKENIDEISDTNSQIDVTVEDDEVPSPPPENKDEAAIPIEEITAIETEDLINKQKETAIEDMSTEKAVDHQAYFYESLEHGNYSMAYWISVSCDVNYSPDLIGALAIGSQVGVGSTLPAQLQGFFNKIIAYPIKDTPSKLILLSSIIGSALFTTPSSNEIFTLIAVAECGIPSIDDLIQFIKSEFLYKSVTISPKDINLGLVYDGKEQRLKELKDRSQELIQRNSSAYFTNYIPAKVLLRYLYREGSELTRIHRIIERVKFDPNKKYKSEIETIKVLLAKLNGEKIVSEAHTLGLNKVSVPIKGIATNQLIRRINDTISIGREWCNLFADETSNTNEKTILNLQQLLTKSHTDLKKAQINKAIDSIVQKSCKSILDQLNGETIKEFTPLNHEIIGIENLILDDELEPNSENGIIECFMKKSYDKPSRSPKLINTFIKRKEFIRADRVIDLYNLDNGYRDRLDYALDDEHRKLTHRIDELKTKVEDAYLLGRLENQDDEGKISQEALRSNLIGTLEQTKENIQKKRKIISWRIRDFESSVDEIDAQLKKIETQHNITLNEDFTNIISQFPNSDSGKEDKEYVKQAFNDAIKQNDNIAAFELLNRAREAIQKKIPFPKTEIGQNEELTDFLNNLSSYQEGFGKKKNINTAISAIKNRKTYLNINFGSIDKAHQSSILSGLSGWRDLLLLNTRKSQGKIQAYLKNITDFLYLPFRKESQVIRSQFDEDFVYITSSLNFNINSCPIPTFGSSLGTTAHIVISKDKKGPDQLGSFLFRHELQQKPVFLFYLQEMGLQLRTTYQKFFAKKKLPVLLIDICMAYHLCKHRNRLPILFKIALPFTWAQPYLMKGENVPQETFVGRSDEVQSIQDPDGSCIIFGGRQLGKSALLRHIYNTNKTQNNNGYIAYLDIDEIGMEPQTHDQMQAEFWRKVFKELVRENFLPELAIHPQKGAKRIEAQVSDEILNTLKNDPDKRLSLLLDETDHFLDNDSSRNFPIIRRLRGMMATTGRRFKVVLAGLQSVQRYKNWKNHPFAQLGTDIVVRPLNPEAAQALILRPLNALGFSFEKTGLILRILSQSNYHPGLIQIFCHRLIEKLYLKWGNKTSDKVVRTVELSDLQMIESDPNFIEDIRNRFDWTLDLDDRYKVLIYSLVLTENPTTSRSEREFMALAREWWPDVFDKMDQQSLRAVLDEMDGLGVLVREDEEATRMYRLRSPNLLRLLGTRDQIEDELLRITDHSSPRILNPRNFHSTTNEKTFCFGPLTKEQEGQISNAINDEIFGITIISGSSALGLNDVPNQIQNIFNEMDDWKELILQFNTARDRILNFVKKNLKQRNRTNLFSIIQLGYLQNDLNISKFITSLLDQNIRACTSSSRGHIFLLIDPDHSWSWLCDDKREDILEHQRINYTELKRWSNGAITNALENIGTFTGAKDKGEEIFSLTLGWHNLIDIGLRNVGKSTSKSNKNNIIDIWKDKIKSFFESKGSNRFEFLKEFALSSENASLSKCIADIFNWGEAESKDSIILTQDIFDCVKNENKDAEEILSDGGYRLRQWLRMHDIAHRSEDNSWIVNPVAKEIFLNTPSSE